jgi:AraC-like DNA-binding protein
MENKIEKLAKLLLQQLPDESFVATSINGVNLYRVEKSFERKPASYNSEIIIIAHGEKRVFLGDSVYTYNPSRYLVLPVPLPVECEAIVSPDSPLLGITIKVDPMIIGEILLELDDTRPPADDLHKGIYTAGMTDGIADTAVRLLEALSSPDDGRILGPMIMREIIYRVLRGENGEALQALAYRDRRFFQIAKVLNKIHQAYHENYDIRTLAMEAGMSVSSFHTSFKAVTDSSPLQYIKSVRLHKARELMIQDGVNAYNAALRVGYESPSQFNREYKRFFGITPAKDAAGMLNDNAKFFVSGTSPEKSTSAESKTAAALMK